MLASDAKKIFSLYWSIDGLKKLPEVYPKKLATRINLEKPLKVLNKADNTIYKVIISALTHTLQNNCNQILI